ncbi:GNAT family N-acetyltransferase [Nocardioides coralli]|uniref:GNAT family N-acetyltransferase n=1 Tax=Nocardioides coralli TaxID=2872154 RepID=UPI001CA3DB79|nr:GNAT family N-acetyltransferase [Nocardioides coralli]QZY29252.1 GNAT family N-acetyltransferase [Nocardioides coralli]
MQLQSFDPSLAATVSSWAPSAEEVRSWCARSEAPVPPEVVAGWGEADDVEAYLLVDDGTPAAYGELWLDEEEGEVELARLLVDPAGRGRGLGRRLTRLLAERAREAHPALATVCLRVLPDNVAGHRAYLAAGFAFVDAETEQAWNAGQPTAYRWMVLSADA